MKLLCSLCSRIMMTTEADLSKDDLTRYYGNIADQIGDITHVPMNFDLISDFKTPDSFSATAVSYNTTLIITCLKLSIPFLVERKS